MTRRVLSYPLAAVVATWDAIRDGLATARVTWTRSYRATVDENR